MKFERKPDMTDKEEFLFQGFYLLFACPTSKHQEEMVQILCALIMDPDISKEQVQQAVDRAIAAHLNEKKLEATFND